MDEILIQIIKKERRRRRKKSSSSVAVKTENGSDDKDLFCASCVLPSSKAEVVVAPL